MGNNNTLFKHCNNTQHGSCEYITDCPVKKKKPVSMLVKTLPENTSTDIECFASLISYVETCMHSTQSNTPVI